MRDAEAYQTVRLSMFSIHSATLESPWAFFMRLRRTARAFGIVIVSYPFGGMFEVGARENLNLR